jgi:hypothetical protein
MGFRLRMSAEIHDWLTDLRDSDRPAAMIAGQALTALATEGDALGPPLLISLDGQVPPANLADALDQAYQDRLEALNILRRRVADAAWLRKHLEDQIAGARVTAQDRVTELRRQLTGAIEAEQQLTVTSQRQQAQTDAFRTRKEVLKATYTLAQAEHAIEQDWVQYGGDGGTEDDQAPGTVLLIAVFEGQEAVRDHYRQAVVLASAALRQARAGQAPEMAAHTFGSTQSFLQEFFPDQLDEVRAGATALVARNRA